MSYFSTNSATGLDHQRAYHEPTRWYSNHLLIDLFNQTNIDWAGNIVERVTGMSLNDYFQEHIFKPLGVKNISMFPDEYMKSKLAHMHFKQTTGSIYNRPHLLRAPLLAGKEDIPKIYNSAGAGCFAQPVEYTSSFFLKRQIIYHGCD